MYIKYNAYIQDDSISNSLKRITNLIYKLLPNREENIDWEKPLETVIVELAGMDSLLLNDHDILFPLLCKLEGLHTLTNEVDFPIFRRTIFECLSLTSQLKERVENGGYR